MSADLSTWIDSMAPVERVGAATRAILPMAMSQVALHVQLDEKVDFDLAWNATESAYRPTDPVGYTSFREWVERAIEAVRDHKEQELLRGQAE